MNLYVAVLAHKRPEAPPKELEALWEGAFFVRHLVDTGQVSDWPERDARHLAERVVNDSKVLSQGRP